MIFFSAVFCCAPISAMYEPTKEEQTLVEILKNKNIVVKEIKRTKRNPQTRELMNLIKKIKKRNK